MIVSKLSCIASINDPFVATHIKISGIEIFNPIMLPIKLATSFGLPC